MSKQPAKLLGVLSTHCIDIRRSSAKQTLNILSSHCLLLCILFLLRTFEYIRLPLYLTNQQYFEVAKLTFQSDGDEIPFVTVVRSMYYYY